MGSNQSVLMFLFFLLVGLASSAYISYDAMQQNGFRGRALLQLKNSCPINFEDKNYTIITSKCRGPNYNKQVCCQAFKEFTCPFSDYVNDLKSDCSMTLFAHINLYGNYPPGLFSNMCTGDIECGYDSDSKTNGALKHTGISSELALMTGFLVLLFNIF